jgi:hypothetical protein
MMANGHVYIFLNAAMPGMLKIGMTSRTPEERARELSQGTGVAVPFSVAFSEEVPDCARAEALIHSRLARFRLHQGREFFHLDLRTAIRELSKIADEVRSFATSVPGSESLPTPSSAASELSNSTSVENIPSLLTPVPETAGGLPCKDESTASFATSGKPLHPRVELPQSVQAAHAETQHAIIDAILGAYPHNTAGRWLSAKAQCDHLRKAALAKFPDGSIAFEAMIRWDGKDRTNRMKHHVKAGLAIKAEGRNLYMLAQGVKPAMLGVTQSVVDALANHGVIPRYDVDAGSHTDSDS